jgi:hypothetical protein
MRFDSDGGRAYLDGGLDSEHHWSGGERSGCHDRHDHPDLRGG